MILEIFRLAYENPGTTFLFLLGLAIVAAEFEPVKVVKFEQRKEKENSDE